MEVHELVSRCKAGDRQALHLLYQQYKPQLLGLCKQYSKDDDVAEDLLHDAFVIILTSFDKLEDSEKLASWMGSIVRNIGYHYRQHLNKEQTAIREMAKEGETLTETTLSPDYNQLQALVSQLPQGYQRVFRLSVFEGLTHQEISQMLGIAPHSSSSQLFHAKRTLQALIKKSWLLVLLLIAIPTAVWKLLYKPAPETPTTIAAPKRQNPKLVVEQLDDQPVYSSIHKKAPSHPIRYQAEAVIMPDSIPEVLEEQIDTLTEITQVIEKEVPTQDIEGSYYITLAHAKKASWGIKLVYNGQLGRQDDYLAATTIGKGSFDALSNLMIPTGTAFSNWIDYNSYLNTYPQASPDAETRSIMNIAAQNSVVNNGMMEAHYEHKLPVTIQLLLNRQLSKRLSLETGLSYTQLSSIINTGSRQAYIQEYQRLHYLGIPVRFNWQWFSKKRLSLYSSAGGMLELPIHCTVEVNHISDGSNSFNKKTSLDANHQWSTTFGLGLQYGLTPHLGIYLEPSLQYYFNDGSDLKTYRTEHPISVTLPIGVRLHW